MCLIDYECMEDWASRLKRLRMHTRLSQAKVARELGISAPSVAQWEIGRSKPMLDRLPQLAALYGVSLEDLCGSDLGSPKEALKAAGCTLSERGTKVPVSGFVAGADRVVLFEDGDIEQDGEAYLPFQCYDGIVLRVQGESMVPRYKPGEVIGIHLPGRETFSLRMIGKDVVARLSDGQMVLKTVASGPKPATFVLTSVNPMVPPIFEPEIEWVAPVEFHLVG